MIIAIFIISMLVGIIIGLPIAVALLLCCLLYTSPSPRDA